MHTHPSSNLREGIAFDSGTFRTNRTRSYAPRRNAVFDAPRRLHHGGDDQRKRTQERPGWHSHGGPWERVLPAQQGMSGIESYTRFEKNGKFTACPHGFFGVWLLMSRRTRIRVRGNPSCRCRFSQPSGSGRPCSPRERRSLPIRTFQRDWPRAPR